MTSYQIIHDAFLAKVRADDWSNETDLDVVLADWESIMESALPYFKFPKSSLIRTATVYAEDEIGTETAIGSFTADLSDQEIQIIASLMKCEWLDRTICSWENVKTMYDERDFSQANLLDKFIKLLEVETKKAKKLQKLYSRSVEGVDGVRHSYDFTKLAGK